MIMKNIISFLASMIFLLMLYSCSKSSHDSTFQNDPNAITGEWKWIGSRTGWGSPIDPNSDSVIILKLNRDSSYLLSLNNIVKYSGIFSSRLMPDMDSLLVLEFNSHMQVNQLKLNNKESILYFKNDTCQLYDFGTADGSVHSFHRN